jgi:hypothetical protein
MFGKKQFINFNSDFNIFKHINIPIFLISLIIGLFLVYITAPYSRTIYVYPTPENTELLQYRDKTNNCFNIIQKEVTCPKNESDITEIPAQS